MWIAIVLGGIAAVLLLTVPVQALDRRRHALGGPLRAIRNLVVPTTALLLLLRTTFGLPHDDVGVRLLESLLWLEVIWVCLSLLKVALAAPPYSSGAASPPVSGRRMPGLFLDLARVLLIVLGACFVVAGVWGLPLGGLVTTLGVGSLVLGLALQDTLGGLFAGVALTFERAFAVGDWVRIGELTGQVVEIDWRAVRLRTRQHDIVVVPNLILGKETFENYSRPTRLHVERVRVSFGYDDPPNKVKRVLQRIALSTRGIIGDPTPSVRTLEYGEFAIVYEIRFVIDDFARQLEIRDELMTQVWYAASRNGLQIQNPVRAIHKTEMPPDARGRRRDARTALQGIPVFVPLNSEELDSLTSDATEQTFAKGERVVHQGDAGDALYFVRAGTAVVSVAGPDGVEREVARLGRGEFFGEMALLTGEPRSANVTAAEDLDVIVVFKEAVRGLLERRPSLAQEIAEIVEARRQGLRAVAETVALAPEQRAAVRNGTNDLVLRIKRFFGV